MNDLVQLAELSGFPGAPFSQALLDSAVADVRGAAGWHIAPERTETIKVDSSGGRRLFLPSLFVTAVSEVTDVSTGAAIALTDWTFKSSGVLYRSGGWPVGDAVVQVTLTHGYETCPADLLPVVAERCQGLSVNQAYSSETVGPFTARLRTAGEATPGSSALARYRIPAVA